MFKKVLVTLALLLSFSVSAEAIPNGRDILMYSHPVYYSSDAQTLFKQITTNGCTAPTNRFKSLANDFINSAKSHGYWNKLNFLDIFAAVDQCTADINWRLPASFPVVVHGAPPFTQWVGYMGTGSVLNYLDLGWNPSTNAAGIYLLNSAHLMAWGLISSAGVGFSIGNQRAFMGIHVSPTTASIELNAAASWIPTTLTGAGMFVATRDSSTSQELYEDGSVIGTDSTVSSAIISQNILGLCRSAAGVCSGADTNQYAAMSAGSSLTSTNVTNYHNDLFILLHGLGTF